MPVHIDEVRPLQTFEGTNTVLELFPNIVVFRRVDSLAKFLPTMFEQVRTIPLDQIRAVHLHDYKPIDSQRMMFSVQLADHKYITLIYDVKDHPQARDMKNAIDDLIRKKHTIPARTV